tara:strand:- start:4624 stop:5058 length:435 start_codon:yes stop_codon:yes gene_type:complete
MSVKDILKAEGLIKAAAAVPAALKGKVTLKGHPYRGKTVSWKNFDLTRDFGKINDLVGRAWQLLNDAPWGEEPPTMANLRDDVAHAEAELAEKKAELKKWTDVIKGLKKYNVALNDIAQGFSFSAVASDGSDWSEEDGVWESQE